MDRDRVESSVENLPGEYARATVEVHHAHAPSSTYVYDFVWGDTAPGVGPFCTDVDGNVLMDFTGHVGAMPPRCDILPRLTSWVLRLFNRLTTRRSWSPSRHSISSIR